MQPNRPKSTQFHTNWKERIDHFDSLLSHRSDIEFYVLVTCLTLFGIYVLLYYLILHLTEPHERTKGG